MSLSYVILSTLALLCIVHAHKFRPNATQSISPNFFPELRHRSVPTVDLNALGAISCDISCCESVIPDSERCPPLFPECSDKILAPCWDTVDESNCYTYSLDCFCNAPRPLQCGWSCGWWEWMEMEDWFSKTCPQIQVELSFIIQ